MLPGKRALILGIGKTGLSVLSFMREKGYDVLCTEDNDSKIEQRPDIPSIKISTAMENLDTDILIVSPGIRSFFQPHPLVLKALEKNIPIITDLDILQHYNPNATYFGITGTNGKSTTSAMLHHALQGCSVNSALGGNIGTPMLTLDGANVIVLELSSYQLENAHTLKMNSAAILNITEDHTEHHGSMRHYTAAKERILQQAKTKILNLDDNDTALIAQRYPDSILFSVSQILSQGISIVNNQIYQDGKPIGQRQPTINMQGSHNMSNAAAVLSMCHQANVDMKLAIEAVNSFPGLPHRGEHIHKIDRITFINNSKATTPEASLKTLSLYKNIYLIAGGLAKQGVTPNAAHLIDNVLKVFLIGKAQELFYQKLRSSISCQKCDTLKNAVHQAYYCAAREFCNNNPEEECTILLSPMCTSFDQYNNFEERGEHFRQIVKELNI